MTSKPNQQIINPRTIPGWGSDIDPANNPTYPMRDISQDGSVSMDWPRPTLQKSPIEVLRSTERPSLSAVFGTSAPPRALSGLLRRWAFQRSESKWSHWLILLLADRINVVEGIFSDLLHGRIPNIFGEMGIRSELKYNKLGLMRKTLVPLAVITIIAASILYAKTDH